ncbi:hypothetical protein NDU88_008994 [Pleurodeles waltl]|uniref:Uncharacterized protein n=1 Tax=Pleurodeles waltl TaxID=8319 RepID=A0AAV7NAR1_PLEWA|nr:hypothetical protein NDU88_008994 [Pleurodeles waltl]
MWQLCQTGPSRKTEDGEYHRDQACPKVQRYDQEKPKKKETKVWQDQVLHQYQNNHQNTDHKELLRKSP